MASLSRRTIAAYDVNTLARLDFRRATSGGASPIYGYAVASDKTHTYLFGNTFEQNLAREGGWFNGPHSGTKMFLARVPRGQLLDAPEYWTQEGWTTDRRNAHAFLQRYWSEFPMQPRYMDGQWDCVDCCERLLGRCVRTRCRQRSVGSVDDNRESADCAAWR